MRTTTITCDICHKPVEDAPDSLGKTFIVRRNGTKYDVSIMVDFEALAGKPAGSADTCTDCFWSAVKEAVRNYITWN
jgi:hypothetical protein